MNKILKTLVSSTLTAALALTGSGFAGAAEKDFSSFKISGTFGDNMVIQRGEQFRVFGFADSSLDGERVTVEFKDQSADGIVENGEWSVTYLKALEAETEGSDMTVRCGTKEITLKNILVGDVYMAVGQSNIAYTFDEAVTNSPENYGGKNVVPDESDPIRICNNGLVYQNAYPAQGSDEECKDIIQNGGWQKTSPESVKDFSAVGYFFARDIIEKTDGKIPVGIIEINGNGQAINAFLPNEVSNALKTDEKDSDGLYKTNYAGTKIPTRFMYNHYMRPFKHTAIAGMIWYQGESDFISGSYETYVDRFSALVEYMRQNSNLTNKNFPVFVTELPSMFNGTEEGWAFLPTAAVRAAMGLIPTAVDNTYMAATSDIWKDREHKNNLHPYCKYYIAKRLSALAGSVIYDGGGLNMTAGPQIKGYRLSEDKKSVTLYFDYVGKGLMSFENGIIKGFLLNNNTSPLSTEITGYNSVTLTSDEQITQVKYNAPSSVYNPGIWYAATENTFPETVNMCSSAGIPMISFSTAVSEKGQMTVFSVGDVNADGEISVTDALLVLQSSVGKIGLEKEQKSLADANLDGFVTVTDALLILQASVNKVSIPKV